MIPRKSNLFFLFLAVSLMMLVFMFIHAGYRRNLAYDSLHAKREFMRQLTLTDLCLVTEASYTRHLSQADRHTAFQDSPMALEHFPSGSIYLPPSYLRKINE